MIKFKDVAHLYLGCKVQVLETKKTLVFNEIRSHEKYWLWCSDKSKQNIKHLREEDINSPLCGKGFGTSEIKPLLYPLSAITDEQVHELEQAMWGNWEDPKLGDKDQVLKMFIQPMPSDRLGFEIYVKAIKWFHENSFDLYELIPSSEALDATNTPELLTK